MVRHWIERGYLPALKIGGRVLLRRATLEKFLEGREREWIASRRIGCGLTSSMSMTA